MSFTDSAKIYAELLVRWGKLSEQNLLIYMLYKVPVEMPDIKHQPLYREHG